MTHRNRMIFNYAWARTYVGLVALFIAAGSVVLHNINLDAPVFFDIPPSISDTYHSGARDFFVAQLFVVAAFLISYNGHNGREWCAAKLAGLSAMMIAWFPTSCQFNSENCESASFLFIACDSCAASKVHYIAAIVFFGLLVYFCYRFYLRVDEKLKRYPSASSTKVLKRRKVIYALGGIVMALTIVLGGAWYKLTKEPHPDLLFWIEAVCLVSFGVVWLVAGKKVVFFK